MGDFVKLHRHIIFRRLGAAAVATALVSACVAPAAFGALAPAKKHLSLSKVTITDSQTGNGGLLWIAQAEGFFKKQGLSVTVDNTAGTAASDLAFLLSGGTEFRAGIASAPILAAQSQAPVRAIYQMSVSAQNEVAINLSAAQAHGIPQVGSTAKGALAQLLALKGSHLTIGVSNTASDGFNWFVTVARLHGLTVGINTTGTANDVNISSVGSVTALTSGIISGKLDGIINMPPVTVVANTIDIQLSKIPPASTSAGTYVFTTTTILQQHSDTVQAVVNAFAQATVFAKTHPAKAERDFSKVLATLGITSPEEDQYLFQGVSATWKNPFPTKLAYANAVALLNGAQPTPVTVPYSVFVVTKYVTAATKNLHLHF
jgi:ABC-type nitrate/sulfonate/bicarbonate transport system substrate-binding protein